MDEADETTATESASTESQNGAEQGIEVAGPAAANPALNPFLRRHIQQEIPPAPPPLAGQPAAAVNGIAHVDAQEESDSGTDTDDEGMLIKQAAAELQRHKRSRQAVPAKSVVPSRTPTPPLHQRQSPLRPSEPSHPLPPPRLASSPAAARQSPQLPGADSAGPSRPGTPALGAAAAAASTSASTSAAPAPAPRAPPRRPAGAITLKSLIQAGFLLPGEQVLCVEYKGNSTWGDLNQEGQIRCNGMVFESPSAFSIYIKRLVNPTRKADDGWKAVKYAGKLLEHYKDEFLRHKYRSMTAAAASPAGEPSDLAGPSGATSAEAAGAAAAAAGSSQGAEQPPKKRQRVRAPPKAESLPPRAPPLASDAEILRSGAAGPSHALHNYAVPATGNVSNPSLVASVSPDVPGMAAGSIGCGPAAGSSSGIQAMDVDQKATAGMVPQQAGEHPQQQYEMYEQLHRGPSVGMAGTSGGPQSHGQGGPEAESGSAGQPALAAPLLQGMPAAEPCAGGSRMVETNTVPAAAPAGSGALRQQLEEPPAAAAAAPPAGSGALRQQLEEPAAAAAAAAAPTGSGPLGQQLEEPPAAAAAEHMAQGAHGGGIGDREGPHPRAAGPAAGEPAGPASPHRLVEPEGRGGGVAGLGMAGRAEAGAPPRWGELLGPGPSQSQSSDDPEEEEARAEGRRDDGGGALMQSGDETTEVSEAAASAGSAGLVPMGGGLGMPQLQGQVQQQQQQQRQQEADRGLGRGLDLAEAAHVEMQGEDDGEDGDGTTEDAEEEAQDVGFMGFIM